VKHPTQSLVLTFKHSLREIVTCFCFGRALLRIFVSMKMLRVLHGSQLGVVHLVESTEVVQRMGGCTRGSL